jgi:hypothetical protein
MEALLAKLDLALAIGLQLLILFLLIKRRLLRRFLWFFIYIAYELISAALRLSAAGNLDLYRNVYWVTSLGGVIFAVMAVRESFVNVFRRYTRFRWFTRVVWSCVTLTLIYSALKAWAFPPVHANRVMTIIIDLEVAVDYSLAMVGILYFLLVRIQRIREHQWESAIISGFMTIGAFWAVGALVRSVYAPRFRVLYQWIGPVAYLLAEIEWAFILSRPERETPKWVRERELTIDDLTRVDEYIKVLERIWGRKQ